MNLRSPIGAVLWEIWRVTRTEIAWRLALGTLAGLTALLSFAAYAQATNLPTKVQDFGAVVALIVLVAPHFLGWAFLSRLNGGRAGYPFHLIYPRPIGTATLVCVQLAYLTVVPIAIYLVSALLLRALSGYSFPLLPVAAWIATVTLTMTMIYWCIRSALVQQFLGAVISGAILLFTIHRLSSHADALDWRDSPKLWPTIFELPPTDYALMASIGLASFAIASASVARQRHGDARAAWTPGTGWPEWLVNLFRFPCPTSSATRAQVWFDLKSRGLPLLTIGVALAILNPLLFAISNYVDAANPHWSIPVGPMVLLLAMMSVPAVLMIGGVNAFGIRWQQGGTYFEATQPYSTTQLASLKVVVRSACLLAALVAVSVSAWTFLSYFPLLTGDKLFLKLTGAPLIAWQQAIEEALGALSVSEQLAFAVVAAIGIFVWVAVLTVIVPLWVRYPRRGNIAASCLLLGALSLALLASAGRIGFVSEILVDAVFATTRWIAAAAMVFSTLYLLWSGFAERLLSVRYAFGALLMSAAFAAAWMTVLQAAGLQPAGMLATNAASMLAALFVPLLAAVVVPWSLSRFRHI